MENPSPRDCGECCRVYVYAKFGDDRLWNEKPEKIANLITTPPTKTTLVALEDRHPSLKNNSGMFHGVYKRLTELAGCSAWDPVLVTDDNGRKLHLAAVFHAEIHVHRIAPVVADPVLDLERGERRPGEQQQRPDGPSERRRRHAGSVAQPDHRRLRTEHLELDQRRNAPTPIRLEGLHGGFGGQIPTTAPQVADAWTPDDVLEHELDFAFTQT